MAMDLRTNQERLRLRYKRGPHKKRYQTKHKINWQNSMQWRNKRPKFRKSVIKKTYWEDRYFLFHLTLNSFRKINEFNFKEWTSFVSLQSLTNFHLIITLIYGTCVRNRLGITKNLSTIQIWPKIRKESF